jgi:Flp pilus assembly pilin Flp
MPESLRDFLFDESGDMVERGLIMAAIVVAAVAIWISIGSKLAGKLGQVDAVIK